MRIVDKEQFTCKCLEQINGCHYLYRKQVKSVIKAVQCKFQMVVADMTEMELEEYVANEIKQCWGIT